MATVVPEKPLATLAQDPAVMVALAYIEGEEIAVHWEARYVLWSLALAALSAFCAFTTTAIMKKVNDSDWYWYLLVRAGLCLGVCTVWGMHFVGMQALVLRGGVDSGAQEKVDVQFEPTFTIASALAAWVIATIALHIALLREGDILEAWQASKKSRRLETGSLIRRLLRLAISETPVKRILAASLLVAVGVCVMHYMGMLSQSGRFVMEYDVFIVGASAAVALVVSFAGLSIFFLLPNLVFFRVLASIVVSVAVNSMHYTGMQSASYFYHTKTGIWGADTAAMDVPAVYVFVAVGFLNMLAMAVNGAFLEYVVEEEEETWKYWGGFAVVLVLSVRVALYFLCEVWATRTL